MNRDQIRQENQAIQKRYENKYLPLVSKTIQSIIDRTSAIVKEKGAHAAKTWLDNKIENTAMTEVIQKMALEVGLRFARKTYINLNVQKRAAKKSIYFEANGPSFNPNVVKGFGFNQAWTDFIKKYLYTFIVEKISFAAFETTKDVLFTVLNKSIAEGWGVDKTVQALDDLPLSDTQAARIVRTETTRAANVGSMAASKTFPYQQTKEWLSAHDDRVRDTEAASHRALDGQVVNSEDVFIDPVSGNELEFPGDPRGGASETINCRCSSALMAKIGENGRLIPKLKATA